MVQILHSKYIDFVQDIGVSQEIFQCLVKYSTLKVDDDAKALNKKSIK